MKEVWKPIKDDQVQERYAVSNLGRVIDLKNRKYMNFNDNGAGYMTVPLMGDKSKPKIRYVHRLVAKAFLDNPENLPQVGHKDHSRDNNALENLYWTTQKNNTQDGIKAGRINAKKRGETKKLTKVQICEIALLSTEGYGVNEIAQKLDFPRTTISSVFNGRSNWELFQFALEEIKNFQNPPCKPKINPVQCYPYLLKQGIFMIKSKEWQKTSLSANVQTPLGL
jgi:hypothetical protein